MRQLASKNMAENMVDMEENSAEVRQVTRCKMSFMEDKAEDMAHDMRRKTL